MKHKILIIDTTKTVYKTLCEFLGDDYLLFYAPDGLDGIAKAKDGLPDVILLAEDVPKLNGYETIKLMKADPAIAHIPVIFITTTHDVKTEIDGMLLGAVDCLIKPCNPVLAKIRIDLHLREEEQKKTLTDRTDKLHFPVRHTVSQLLIISIM